MAGSPPLAAAADYVRQRLVRQVRAVFNDVESGEQSVLPSDNALFIRDTPIRMVHADVVSMMVGGMAALLLQMLHPHALRGVLEFSNFREDMHGRLRRTARFIAVTTYGDRNDAEAAIERVNAIHAQVKGTLPDGTPYSARDPATLAWVHLTEAVCFLDAYCRYVRPEMPLAEQDEYFRQFAIIARKLGCDPVPESKAQALAMFRTMRSQLHASTEAREVARLITDGRTTGAARAIQPALAAAAVDLLPPFARTMLALEHPGLAMIPARLTTSALGGTLRWAFRPK
ncbi:oxygenase MpaB family protein [Alteraurantiacibacter aestuarii]|uniref:oxygenase MpaB family protein n=1 Tax=Alteraurantiacibacter aestuarii TaxID=650004 RepID=UPI0031D12E2C